MRDNLSYLAGIIDGEGTIGIHKSHHKYTNIEGGYTYQQYLEVTNTNILLLDWLVENFGGSISKRYKSSERHKDAYKWFVTGRKSYKLIKTIRSYLLIKQEQADCAIELWEKVSKWHYGANNRRPLYKTKLAEGIFQRNKELNKRGVDDVNQNIEPKLIRKVITLEEFEI